MAISITKPTVGGSNGTWGTELNTALDTIVAGVNAAQSGIPATTVTAKGDLLVATASGTVTRQAVGTTGYQLTADNTATTGVAWKLSPGSLVAKLRATSTQTLTASTYTNLTMHTADFDRYGAFGGSSATFTPGVAGWYELAGGVSYSGTSVTSTTNAFRSCQWAVNGTAVPASTVTIPDNDGVLPEAMAARTVTVFLAAGDNISLQGWHNNTAGCTTNVTSPHGVYITVKWLGAN